MNKQEFENFMNDLENALFLACDKVFDNVIGVINKWESKIVTKIIKED